MISVVAHERCAGKRPTLQRQKYLFYASVASLALQVTGMALLGQVQQPSSVSQAQSWTHRCAT